MIMNTKMKELILFLLIQDENKEGMYSEFLGKCIDDIKIMECVECGGEAIMKTRKKKTIKNVFHHSLKRLIEEGMIKERKIINRKSSPRIVKLTLDGMHKAIKIHKKHQDFIWGFNYIHIRKELESEIDEMVKEGIKKTVKEDEKKELIEKMDYLIKICDKLRPPRRNLIKTL
jgi:hypothetical protein